MNTYVQKLRGLNTHGTHVPTSCYCGKPGKTEEWILGRLSGHLCSQHAKDAKTLWEQHSGSTAVVKLP